MTPSRIPRLAIMCAALLVPYMWAQPAWTFTRFDIPNVETVFGIAHANGRFVAVVQGGPVGSRVAVSSDGLTWTQPGTNMPGASLDYFADAFFTMSGTRLFRSADGLAWQEIYRNPPGSSVQRGTHNGRGMLLDRGTRDGVLTYSADLNTWTSTTPLPHSTLPGATVDIRHMAYAAGRYYIAYGIGNAPSAGGPHTASTVDGQSWDLVPELRGVSGMAAGNARLVAIVGGQVFVTTNGSTFSSAFIPADMSNPEALFFAGGRFLTGRTMHASTDGLTWSQLAGFNKAATTRIRGVTYGNGRYVAVGSDFQPPSTSADVLAYLPVAAPPLIVKQPSSRTVAEGGRAVFSITVENADIATTYQWRRDGVAIAGANHPVLTLQPVSFVDAGRYDVVIRNAVGSATTDAAQLTLVPIAAAGRIINLSILASIDAVTGPDATLTLGFVVGGSGTTGTKSLLVRAGGPSLARFGVIAPNPNPSLKLFSGTTPIAQNDDWGGEAAVIEVTDRVGAFPFDASDSFDAAVFSNAIALGSNSVTVSGAGGATGTVIAEVYDATPHAALTVITPRLVNVSVLKSLSPGTTLSAGFVIGGSTSKMAVIRVIGASLAAYGVANPLPDPQLTLYRSGLATPIAANDNWGGGYELGEAFEAVGAFALPLDSYDAALVVTLEPGSYIAQATGNRGLGGTTLVEIYEMP